MAQNFDLPLDSTMKTLTKDTTMQDIAQTLKKQLALQELVAYGKIKVNDWKTIRGIVQAGEGEKYFPIGSQFIEKWVDTATGTEYEMPFDVVHHGTAVLENGEEVPAMYLQSHYATPFGVQFSNNVPMRYAAASIPAGTYHFKIGSNWGSYCVSGKSYQFTLTKAVPAGGVLAGLQQCPDIAVSSWRIKTFNSPYDQNPLEEVAVMEGTAGTDLGTFSGNDTTVVSNGNGCNDLYRIGYGYNNWKKSAMRQWLNSDKAKGNWWQKQSDLEYRPNELHTKDGFMRGFDADFLGAIACVKVTTMTNTINDGGAADETFDKFFLPSLEEEFCQTQAAGEGVAWEYWKRALKSPTAQPHWSTWPNHIRYGVENHLSAQVVRLRSAYRGNTYNTWYVNASGYLYNLTYAWHSSRVAPACVIA